MPIYLERFICGPKDSLGSPSLHIVQTRQVLSRGPIFMMENEVLRVSIDGPYRLSTQGGLKLVTLVDERLFSIEATEKSYGGVMHFQSLESGRPDIKVEVYIEPKVPAVVVRICGHGTRYLPDLVAVHLGTVKGYENIESYSEPLPAISSEFIVPGNVLPVADSGWIVVVSLEAFPRLLKILKNTW
ncbi:MAG: hypothetical protein K2Y32_16200 [Candidatus Obscuribacterales bacterium]|nr:hypothetical protein [Candidatus Obscuribacterales bacterium]